LDFQLFSADFLDQSKKVNAAPKIQPAMQEGAFAGSQSCQQCMKISTKSGNPHGMLTLSHLRSFNEIGVNKGLK